MRVNRVVAVAMAMTIAAGACGDDGTTADQTTVTSASETSAPSTSATTATSASTSTTAASATTSTTVSETTSITAGAQLEQMAIWPAPGVMFNTPEAAAEDFVSKVVGVTPRLGTFRQGDARSGEIEVLIPVEGSGGTPTVRSVLLMRQLGPGNGWFVLAALSPSITITSPRSTAEVSAGDLTVEGKGRGFEGLIVVEAYIASESATRLDQVTTQGGSTETAEPYSVSVDLRSAASGDTVILLVRGGTGLEDDPGEFSAIPVLVTS